MIELGSRGEISVASPVGEPGFGQGVNFPRDWQEYQELKRPFNLVDEAFDAVELVADGAEAFWADKRLAWDAHKLDFYQDAHHLALFDVVLMPGVAAWENHLLPSGITRHLPALVPWGMRDCYDSPIKYIEAHGGVVTTVFPKHGFNDGNFEEEERLTVEAINRVDDSSDRPLVLLGHSMGAIGQGLVAARHPEVVGKIDLFYQVGGPLPLRVNSIVERFMLSRNRGSALNLARETVDYYASRESVAMVSKTISWVSDQDHVVTGLTPTTPKVESAGHSALLHRKRILDDVISTARGY